MVRPILMGHLWQALIARFSYPMPGQLIPLFKVPPSERHRLRREPFRRVLLHKIDIHWSKSFSTFINNDNGTVTAQFDNAPKSPPVAIVIGCDGACSKVGRVFLPDGCDNKQLPVRCLGV